MSAYLCADDTFDYLAGLMKKGRSHQTFTFYLTQDEARLLVAVGVLDSMRDKLNGISDTEELVTIIRRENITSIVARYGETASGDAHPYTMRPIEGSYISGIAALKTLACLNYQSCEADTYQASIAKRLIDELKNHAIQFIPGYEAAPWGWTRSELTAPSR